MFKGFKDFLLRGNVIDLAVAVVIGAAFSTVVKSFTDGLIGPIIASAGSTDMAGLGFYISGHNKETFVDFGLVLTGLINFLIVAVVVYFVFVLPMNTLQARRRRGEVPTEPEAIPADVELLREIRDLLAQGQNRAE